MAVLKKIESFHAATVGDEGLCYILNRSDNGKKPFLGTMSSGNKCWMIVHDYMSPLSGPSTVIVAPITIGPEREMMDSIVLSFAGREFTSHADKVVHHESK